MKKIQVLIILAMFLGCLSTLPALNPARADGPLNMENQQGFENGGAIPTAFGQTTSPTDPRIIAGNIIKIALGLIGTIFLVLLVIAGFRYMTAGGNEDQVETSKKQIIQAVIGLAIIITAFSITVFVTNSIYNSVKKNPFDAY